MAKSRALLSNGLHTNGNGLQGCCRGKDLLLDAVEKPCHLIAYPDQQGGHFEFLGFGAADICAAKGPAKLHAGLKDAGEKGDGLSMDVSGRGTFDFPAPK